MYAVDVAAMIESLRAGMSPDPNAAPTSHGSFILQLTELITVAEAARAVALGAFDASGEAAADGASTASWLRSQLRLDRNTANAMVHTARALRDLPQTTAALGSGQISYQHAVAISAVTRDAPLETVLATEAEMIVIAERTTPGQLRSYLARIRHAYDPDAMVRDEQDRYARRAFSLATSFERLDAVSGWLDPEVGAGLRIAIEAKLGAPATDDHRSRDQRWHDAFGQLIRDWLDGGELSDRGGERPHLLVTVDHSTLIQAAGAPAAQLDRYGPISGEAARRLACDAMICRAITDGASQILDIGRLTRVVPSAMRRALVLRDGGCIACGAPASWCDAHHVIHWADGGVTALHNLALLCSRHHHQHHEGRLRLYPKDGGGWLTAPPPEAPAPIPLDYALIG